MLIFLYGLDTYRLKRKLRELLEDYKNILKKEADFQFFNFSKQRITDEKGSEVLLEDFKRNFNNISLFGERRVIVLYNLLNSPELKKFFLKKTKDFLKSEDILIFCQEGELERKDELIKFLLEESKVYQFEFLKGLKLKRWLQKEFEKKGMEITSKALDKLILFTEGDTWHLANEIEKLVNFKNKENVVIDPEDIEKLVAPKIASDIFQTIDAIAQKDKGKTLKLIYQHLEKGDSSFYIFSMINFQFRNLLLVRDLMERGRPFPSILRELSLHPLVIKKSFAQARNFSLQELKKIYQKIFQLDFQIKIGRIKPETALDLLTSQI